MKIIANTKRPDFLNRIREANCRSVASATPQLQCPLSACLRENPLAGVSINWHQPFPRAAERQLNSEGCREQNVDFSGLNFLQVARGDFSALGKFFLSHTFTHPLPAHICAEDRDSLPFFFGNGHDILHRGCARNMNDTYIVKHLSDFACQGRRGGMQFACLPSNDKMTCKVVRHLKNESASAQASAADCQP